MRQLDLQEQELKLQEKAAECQSFQHNFLVNREVDEGFYYIKYI